MPDMQKKPSKVMPSTVQLTEAASPAMPGRARHKKFLERQEQKLIEEEQVWQTTHPHTHNVVCHNCFC